MEKVIWETRKGSETEADRLADRFARTETPAARAQRIRAKHVNPDTAAALLRLWR